MSIRTYLRFLGGVAVIVLAGIFLLRTNSVSAFSNDVVDTMHAPSTAFTRLEPYIAGRGDLAPDASSAIRNLNDAYRSAIEESHATLSGMSVPDHEECRSFHAAAVRYFDAELDIVHAVDQYAGMLAQGGADEDSLSASRRAINDLIVDSTSRLFELQVCQRSMAEKFEIDLR